MKKFLLLLLVIGLLLGGMAFAAPGEEGATRFAQDRVIVKLTANPRLGMGIMSAGIADLGIGNNPRPDGSPDYTFSNNAADWAEKRLRVYVK